MSRDLLANLAVIVSAIMTYSALAGWLADRNRTASRWAFALVMAACTFATMAMRFEIAPGVLLDLRNPVIAVAAIFGGLPAALLTAATAIVYRVYLGGAAWLGVSIILASALIGLSIHYWRDVRVRSITWLVAAAAAMSVTTGLAILSLYLKGVPIAVPDAASNTVICFITTLLLGLLLEMEADRRRLSLANHHYRAMVDALPDCLNIKDAQGRFLVANPATARLMGAKDVDALIGKTDADFYPRELAEIYAEDDRVALRSRKPMIADQPCATPDGSKIWLSTLKNPAFDAAGNLLGLVTTNRDITAKKALHCELARMQSYFNQALQQMSDGLAIFDQNGVLQFANEPYRALFPLTGHLRVPGARFSDIVAASINSGEEKLQDGVTLKEHCDSRMAALFSDGDYRLNMGHDRIYEARTRVMANGHALRVMADVTDRVYREIKLEHQALHDPLTGLPNRAYFDSEFMARLKASDGRQNGVVLMLIDLDHFKQVNDNHGHLAGDALLVEVAQRIKVTLRRGDFIARFGGDEFGVLLAGTDNEMRDTDVANRLVRAIGRPMLYGAEALISGATIGIARAVEHDTPTKLIQRADEALYAAKGSGRGTWRVYGVGRRAQAKAG